eukprot:c25478_g1_i2 orf=676-2382(-)
MRKKRSRHVASELPEALELPNMATQVQASSMEQRPSENWQDESLPDKLGEECPENLQEQNTLEPLTTNRRGLPALAWMRHPVDLDSFENLPLQQVAGLDRRLEKALYNAGISTLFPVQVALWRQIIGPGGGMRDLCVCSPTGSGKTLAYVLPIVQMLSKYCLRRLRALVVLPTRDLAVQVKAVFDLVAPAVGLSVGLAVGQTQMTAEAATLVKPPRKYVRSHSRADLAESGVDILVATPGRLMDHITSTEGFTLENLVYLVVDETDRLLRQAYQDWLPNVLDAVQLKRHLENKPEKFSSDSNMISSFISLGSIRTVRHSGLERGFKGSAFPRVMKMVLSATLTRDPAKISQLNLYCPMYISSIKEDQRYKLPSQLEAYRVVCDVGVKPLHLVALLKLLKKQRTIVFTASVVSTHRLFLLLGCFDSLGFKVVEYSSLQHQNARSKSLAAFREGDANVLVASDAMTRGMDVEGVKNVVNYDVPVYAKTYVHRVGRTARAGRSGCSYTLLRKEEVRHFKELLKKTDNTKCKDFKLPEESINYLYHQYIEALEKLKEMADAESITKRGDLKR